VNSPTPLFQGPSRPPIDLVHALAWYAREGLGLERLFNAVTVKRRRNLARPIKRRKSAFRDPMICIDFLAMAWLGITRLSQIEPRLSPRDDLARAFGLARFCDHTTAHNFLNAFHRTHLRQLDEVNARLLRAHGSAAGARAPIVDVDVAQRKLRRSGRRRDIVYRWGVAFCAGEAIAQHLAHRATTWRDIVLSVLEGARESLAAKPRVVRLAGASLSPELLRALAARRLPILTTATWAWALAQRPEPRRRFRWSPLDRDRRVLDLGVAPAAGRRRLLLRTVLVERRAPAPGLRRERVAVVTSLLGEPSPAIVRLAASQSRIRAFFGHRRWPLRDGKMPSGGPRGSAAYLRLATIAMNVLLLFARHVGDEGAFARLRDELRIVPGTHDRAGLRAARERSP